MMQFPYYEENHNEVNIYCPKCGRKLNGDAICINCGFSFNEDAPIEVSKKEWSSRKLIVVIGGFLLLLFILVRLF